VALNLTEMSPDWLLLARYPIVLSCRRIAEAMGWAPTRSTVDTAHETLSLVRGESPVMH